MGFIIVLGQNAIGGSRLKGRGPLYKGYFVPSLSD